MTDNDWPVAAGGPEADAPGEAQGGPPRRQGAEAAQAALVARLAAARAARAAGGGNRRNPPLYLLLGGQSGVPGDVLTVARSRRGLARWTRENGPLVARWYTEVLAVRARVINLGEVG